MSYYTNDEELESDKGSGLYKTVVLLNIILCFCYGFIAKDAVFALGKIIGAGTVFTSSSLPVVIANILHVVELLILAGLLIFILARVPNRMLGGLFVILTLGIVINCISEMIVSGRKMSGPAILIYAFTVSGYFLMVWLLFTANAKAARQMWYMPGLLTCLSSFYIVLNFTAVTEQALRSVQSFATVLVLPLTLFLFMFCFARWASGRNRHDEDDVRPVYVPVQTGNLRPLDIPQSSEEEAKMKCPYCGAPRNLGDRICSRCGREDKSGEQ